MFFLALALFAAGPAAACSAEDAVLVLADDHFLGTAGGADVTPCYRIDLDAPGTLIVGAAAPGLAGGPSVRLAEHRGAAAAGIVVVGRGAARLILWAAEPGPYVFEVAAEDPRQALGEHVFSSRFVTDAAELREAEPRTKDGEDEEIDPILGTSPKRGGATVTSAGSGLLIADAGRQYLVRVAGARELTLEILP